MQFPFAGSDRPPVSAGGFAPWPPRSPTPPVTALFVLFVAFVAGVAFAWVLIFTIDTQVDLSAPAASRLSPAYRYQPNWQMQPEVVCNLSKGICVMRSAYRSSSAFSSPAASRRQTIEELRAKIEAESKPPASIVPCLRMIGPADPLHYSNVKRALLAGADLDEPQMFAMMNMSDNHRCQAIWHHARQNIFELPPFTLSTFRELAERGLAHKPDGSKYHRLTVQASGLASAVADELQRKYKIHAPILVHTRGQIAKHVTFKCTCNWGCALVAGDRMQLKASRAFTSHLKSVNAVAAIEESIARVSGRKQDEDKG